MIHARTSTWCALALAVMVAAPAAAAAQFSRRLSIHLEGGVGQMLSEFQQEELDQSLLFHGTARPGVQIAGPLVLVAGYATWYLPSDVEDAQQHSVTGGLRLEPGAGSFRLFIDGNAGAAFTGGKTRLGIDFGAGFQLVVARVVGIGPYVRYAHTFATEEDHPSDAQMLTAGLSLTLRAASRRESPPPPPPPPPDGDDDGIIDRDDVCPSEAMGPQPDPERRGCPLQDADGDGISDRDDTCPSEGAGEHPDPARRGCPAADSDGDGVYDPDDACPSTPQGSVPQPGRAGCPDPDTDGDAVTDSRDQCPDQHRGFHPDPAREGCPQSDRDNDTVPDAVDACPDEAGAPSPDASRNGCPGLVRVQGGQIQINRPVFFNTRRDTIRRQSNAVLQAVADALRATPEIRRVSIEGHTDDVGDDAFNMELSQRRAQSVLNALTALGIEAERLEAHGLGESRPLQEGTTRAARAANRRVEFRILDPAQQPGADAPVVTPAP